MNSDALFWRERYRQQVQWSRDTRQSILSQVHAQLEMRILEVGCGFGALLNVFIEDGYTQGIGLDIDFSTLSLSETSVPLICADGLHLPLLDSSFDLCVCHYLLLWIADPLEAIREMARAAKPGGWVMALAEPDYGGRIDHPQVFEKVGKLQSESLVDQGADIHLGRQLPGLLQSAGLTHITCGVLPARWQPEGSSASALDEWQVLARDLGDRLPASELESLQAQETRARQEGSRVLFVPTFYAYGQVRA